MKYLQDADGNTLPVPDTTYLFKRVISFLDFAIKGEFSTDFNVPNDSETRKALGFYGLNQVNVPTQKVFSFYEKGNKIADGRVFIRSAGEIFELFFVAGNTNWMNRITGSIKDIDFSDLDVAFNRTNVDVAASATEGLIFPVMDWAYNYRKLSNAFLAKPMRGVGADGFYDFYPVVYSHTIFQRIFEEIGVKTSGDLITDPIFKTLGITQEFITSNQYSSPIIVDSKESMTQADVLFPKPVISTSVLFKLTFDTGTAAFNNANDRIIMPADYGDSAFIYTLNATASGTLYLYKNGAQIASVMGNSFGSSISGTFVNSGIAGDFFEVYFLLTSAARFYTGGSLIINVAGFSTTPGTVFVSNVLPQVDKFAFVKYIAQRFNCLIEFDEVTQTISFNKMDGIQRSNSVDYSDKISGYQVIPSSGYSERNYLRTTEAEELITYKSENLAFGDAVIESDGEQEQDVFKTILRPCESFQNFNLDWLLTSVPLVRLEDADEGIAYSSTSNSGGNTLFNGTGYTFAPDEIVRVDGTYQGFFAISSASATVVTPHATVSYKGASSGKIYRQKIVFPSAGAREVIILASTLVSEIQSTPDIYGAANVKIIDTTGITTATTIAWAYFAKPNIATDLDNNKIGLNYGPVLNVGNISFGDIYHKTLRKIVVNPRVKASFLLSQTEYYNLDMAKYLYLKTKDFAGYFLIENVEGYTSPFEPVEMDLRLIDG